MSLSDVFYDEEPIYLQGEDAEAGADAEGDELTEAQEEYVEEQAEEVFDDLEDKDANEAVAAWHAVKELSGLAMASPMMSHITMAMVAGGFCLSGFLEGFRYRTDVTISGTTVKYYDTFGKVNATVNSTNYWELSQMIRNFSYLGIGGVLMLTSLMAAFGVATGVNLMAWTFLGLAGALAGMVINVIRWWGYYSYYGEGKKSTDTHYKDSRNAMGAIFFESLFDGAMMVGAYIALAGAAEGFMYDAWMSMEEADQKIKFEEWEEVISTRAAEIADEREAAGLDEETAAESKEEEAEEGEEGEGEEDAADGEEGEEDADAEE
jgi:hypothetical protein